MADVVSSRSSPGSVATANALLQDHTLTNSPAPLEERRNSFNSVASSHGQRVDSGIEVSPVSDLPPSRTQTYTSFESHHFVYPPLITGHGHLVRARQTVPAWMGALIVVGGFVCLVGCAIYV
jgi:hypothetical protein